MDNLKFIDRIEKGILWHDEDYSKLARIIENNKGNLFIKRYVTGEIIDISDAHRSYAFYAVAYTSEIQHEQFTTINISGEQTIHHYDLQLEKKESVHLGDEFYKKVKRITLKDMIGD